ncbi:MAG: GNAT family N-acetyltransferase [Dongiaceae bacterium]
MTGAVRQAMKADITAMMELRLSVRENRLSHPGQVTEEDCLHYVERGYMWVWEEAGEILGISASNCDTGWMWALFVRPGHEGRGIGQALFAVACDALVRAGFRTLLLSTDPDTLAARFYRAAGWRETGRTPEGELVFTFDVPGGR